MDVMKQKQLITRWLPISGAVGIEQFSDITESGFKVNFEMQTRQITVC